MRDETVINMLNKIRKARYQDEREINESFEVTSKERDNFVTRNKILMQEAVAKKKPLNEERSFTIDKNTPQFGDVRISQEELLRKTIGENISLESDALKYYPGNDNESEDMTLDASIKSLHIKFQFRYNDSSSDGCFIWCDALQLTEANTRMVGKIRDAFMNWRQSIVQDADLLQKLKKAAKSS